MSDKAGPTQKHHKPLFATSARFAAAQG